MIPVAVPSSLRINGQWIGALFGEAQGTGVLDLEEDNGLITGTAYLYPHDLQIVPAAVRFSFAPPLGTHQFADVPVLPFSPDLGAVITREQMVTLYPMSNVSDSANLSLTFNGDGVFVSFDTPMASGFGNLIRGHTKPSGLAPLAMSWGEYRAQVPTRQKKRFVYRGQAEPWRLRTSFHRTWRKNLDTYTSTLVRETHKALVGHLKTPLDFTKPDDVGAFYNTIQHHGYPTPLLDWTASPYVAAFFAFENAKPDPGTTVRIFAFDRTAWTALRQQNQLSMTRPHLSFVDLLPVGNPRAGPQQSEFTLTNVDDIENHVVAVEHAMNTRYLQAIDIPTSERDEVLADLDLMGLNHATLFPGLDGTCRSMRLKHFGC